MMNLHSPQCTCGDCRNRRVICGLESAGDGYHSSEPERFGVILKADEAGRDRGRRPTDVRVQPVQAPQI
jgi:hypothetical protein